ncbi:MAG: hypothetical protein WBX15_07840 [Thermoanaerobaculia bacterium]
MRIAAVALLLALSFHARASEVVRASIWEFHDSFWMSLHQRLIDDATRAQPRDLNGWSPEEQAAWNQSVAAYRAAAPGNGDMTFARSMETTSDAITQLADDAREPLIDSPLAEALTRAAPVYRIHEWPADEKANRFFIAYASAMAAAEGPRLIHEHEAVYRTPWPARVLVYVTPAAGPYGAYTFQGLSGGWITTMSCRDEGYQGLRALEMLLHESSHAVVGPNRGTVAEAINGTAERLGIRPPHDLWHAIIFATSSELTRRLFVERGNAGFVPSSVDLFTRAWPMYRDAVEKVWLPYLDGRGTLEEAIDRIVTSIAQSSGKRPPPSP